MTTTIASPIELEDRHLLRIGMFSESFDPVQNGVTTSVLTLIAGLRSHNHHVYIFAPAHQQQREMQTYVVRFPSFVSFLNPEYPLAYPFLPRIALDTHFSNLKLQVVHTHTPFVLGLTGANLALQRSIPLVTTFHTLYAQYSHYLPFLPDTVTQSIIETYLPWYYNRCDAIICPSEVAAGAMREMGVTRPIEVIPTGVPLPPPATVGGEVRLCTRRRLGISASTPLLLYAGRLSREKNLDLLIDSFVNIHDRLPTARLALAGGGPYADDLLQRATDLDIRDSVMFLGPQHRSEMDALYAAADVFCFPSASETQGLVIGEARAAGTPCVVVDAGGAPETVEDGRDGFRVSASDPRAFAGRILQILQDHNLATRMSARARENARNYTPERMVERVIAVYGRSRPPATSRRSRSSNNDIIDWEAIAGSVFKFPPV